MYLFVLQVLLFACTTHTSTPEPLDTDIDCANSDDCYQPYANREAQQDVGQHRFLAQLICWIPLTLCRLCDILDHYLITFNNVTRPRSA